MCSIDSQRRLGYRRGWVPCPGSFHFVSSEVFNPSEALNVLNGQLIESGHILMQRDGFLTVHELEEVPPNLTPVIETKDLASFLKQFGFATIPIENGDASILAKKLNC